METKLNPVTINKAVEIYATHPNVHHKDVANELGINPKTLKKLRGDANFWHKVYDYFTLIGDHKIIIDLFPEICIASELLQGFWVNAQFISHILMMDIGLRGIDFNCLIYYYWVQYCFHNIKVTV